MGEQLKMLTRTVMVCLLVTLTYQKATQKNHSISLQESNKNPRQQENLLRGRRFTNIPLRITFRTEIAMTRRMLNNLTATKGRRKIGFEQRFKMPTEYSNITPCTQ